MLIDRMEAQMVVYNNPDNLSKILQFFDGLPEFPKCLVDVNMWFEDTRYKMDNELIPIIDYVPSAKMPLYYNLFIIGGYRTTDYASIHLPLDHISWDIEWDAAEDTKCCCSHHIQTVYWIKAPYLPIITGCDCIKKHKLIPPEELRILRKRKKDTAKILKIKEDIAKKRLVQALKERFLEDEKKRVEKEKQFRIENKLCVQCEKPSKFETCWDCAPKCECGKVAKPPFLKCYECNQKTKKDICIDCKCPFDGKNTYKKCYSCNLKKNSQKNS
jgi:hypothetical protein